MPVLVNESPLLKSQANSMVHLQPKLLTARDFIDHYGDNPQYELIDEELTDVEPTGVQGKS